MAIASDPSIQAWLDQEDKRTAAIIRRHGVYIEYVIGDFEARSTSFAYTIGLFGLGHPELLLLGVDQGTASGVLNHLATRVRDGRDLVPGEVVSFERWAHRVTVEEVPNPGEIVFAANRFYQRPNEASVPVLQLTYDDRGGRFPWDEGYSNAAWIQPRPGEFTAW